MAFPTTLESFTTKVEDQVIDEDHVNDLQTLLVAVQASIGVTDSAVTSSLRYLIENASSIDPGHLHSTSGISGTIAVAQGGTGSATAGGARTNLGVAIGSDVQAYDADLAALAALAVTDGNFIVGNGSAWIAESGATARTSLGVAIGSDVQAYDAGLADVAGLAVTDGNIIVGDGANWVAESGATARTSLGLGSVENTALSTWAGTSNITTLGTIATGTWNGTAIADSYVANDLTISGGTVDNSVIGGSTAAAGTFTQVDVTGEGDLRLQDNTGGQYVGWDAPATVSGSYTMTLPAAIGAVGEVLKINNVDGTLEWGEAGGGSSFTTAVDITVTDNTNPALTILQQGTGNIIDFSSDETNTPHFTMTNTGVTEFSSWANGDVFVVKKGSDDIFTVADDGTCFIGGRYLKTLSSSNRIDFMKGGALTPIQSKSIGMGTAFVTHGVAGSIVTSSNQDMFLDPNGTGTLVLGAQSTSATSKIIDAQLTMQIDVNDASNPALTVDQAGAGGWINFVGTMGDSTKDPTSDAPADWVQIAIGGTTYYLPAYAAS